MSPEVSTALPWWRRARRRFYHRLLLLVLWLARLMPLNLGRTTGRLLAGLGVFLRPKDRQRALGNLARAFPELDPAARTKVFFQSVRALGENFHDTLVTPKLILRPEMVREETGIHSHSLQQELQQLRQEGKGILILTGHLGCWELLGGWLAREVSTAGLGKLAVVTGSIHNPPIDALVQARRQALGMITLPRSGGARPLLRHLGQGGVAAVLLDQNTRVENRPVPFFGQEAPTPVGFAKIAQGRGIPVLPVAIARNGYGHEVRWTDPWIWSEMGPDGSPSLDRFLVWCNQRLEQFIVRNPAGWVWFHKRWPTSEKAAFQESD